MPPTPAQISDPLWRCLCPLINRPIARYRVSLSQSHHRQISRPPHSHHANSRRSTTVSEALSNDKPHDVDADPDAQWRAWSANRAAQTTAFQARKPVQAIRNRWLRQLRRNFNADVDTLYRLLNDAGESAEIHPVENWIHFLITKRNEKPNARMYAALLNTCAHDLNGSVPELKRLLEEMEHNGILHNASTYEAALKALAVHPSYVLRENILSQMRSSWIELSSNGWHYVCCAQLREGQIEMALETLTNMQDKHGLEPRTWLLDLFAHVLAELGEFDAMWEVLARRITDRHTLPTEIFWSNVLSKAAEEFNYSTVSKVWRDVVSPGQFNPSTGLCTMVLDTAARFGDDVLAIDVFRILGNRTSPIQAHHYEALIEAHLRAKEVDMRKILSYISVIEKQDSERLGAIVDQPLNVYLRGRSDLIEETLSLILELRREKKTVPIGVFNGIIEAASICDSFDLPLNLYKNLHEYCGTGDENPANAGTFRALLKGCINAKRKDAAMFVAAEVAASEVEPDHLMYDYLVQACLQGNEGEPANDVSIPKRHLSDAFLYHEEMKARGWPGSKEALSALAKAAARLEDERAQDILRQMEQLRMDTFGIKMYMNDLKLAPADMAAPA